MKKTMLLLATLLIGGMIFTSCSKDPTPTPTPTPSTNTVKVAYQVANTYEGLVMSECFKLNVTYLDANGKEVTESGVSLPWTKEIEVTKPFHAKMNGQIVYNEEELPDKVVFGTHVGIGYYKGTSLIISLTGGLTSGDRDKFLQLMENNPDKLKFTKEKDF